MARGAGPHQRVAGIKLENVARPRAGFWRSVGHRRDGGVVGFEGFQKPVAARRAFRPSAPRFGRATVLHAIDRFSGVAARPSVQSRTVQPRPGVLLAVNLETRAANTSPLASVPPLEREFSAGAENAASKPITPDQSHGHHGIRRHNGVDCHNATRGFTYPATAPGSPPAVVLILSQSRLAGGGAFPLLATPSSRGFWRLELLNHSIACRLDVPTT